MGWKKISIKNYWIIIAIFFLFWISYVIFYQKPSVFAQGPGCGVYCGGQPAGFCSGASDGCTFCDYESGLVCKAPPPNNCDGGGLLCTGDADCRAFQGACTICVSGNCALPPPSCGSACSVNSDCSGSPQNNCTSCVNNLCALPSPTRTPTPIPEQALSIKLTNPGFETDADGNSRPDNWTSDSRFTRNSTVKRSGSYSGRHKATNSGDTSYLIYQSVSGILAGKGYKFTGYVKIPSTSDSFSFKTQVRWLNSSGNIINTKTVKTYSGQTSGWNLFDSGKITAPTGATSARITMNAVGLNATVYVDDFNFSAY